MKRISRSEIVASLPHGMVRGLGREYTKLDPRETSLSETEVCPQRHNSEARASKENGVVINAAVLIPPSTTKKFRTWSELNRAILQNKQAALARVWYLLRSHDHKGKGWLYRDEFIELVTGQLDMTDRRARGLLEKGMGKWWCERDPATITIASHQVAAQHFGVKLGYAVSLPDRAFKRLATFKAFLYASWFARDTWKTVNGEMNPTGGKTISLQRQMELFGVSKSTLRNWQKKANMKTVAQYTYVKEIDEQTPIPEHIFRGEGVFTADVDGDGEKERVWQIPNRISAPPILEAQRAKWQNRRLGSLNTPPKAEPSRRLYYDKLRAKEKLLSGEPQNRFANFFKFIRPGGTRIYRLEMI